MINGEAAAYWIARSSPTTTIVFVAAELTSLDADRVRCGRRGRDRLRLARNHPLDDIVG